MKCDAMECNKEATFAILCDGIITEVCDAHTLIHFSHSHNIQRLRNLVDRDWTELNVEVIVKRRWFDVETGRQITKMES